MLLFEQKLRGSEGISCLKGVRRKSCSQPLYQTERCSCLLEQETCLPHRLFQQSLSLALSLCRLRLSEVNGGDGQGLEQQTEQVSCH